MTTELFSLPRNVSSRIFGSWLDLKSIVSMDSAVCHHSMRSHLIQLLSCKGVVHQNPVLMRGANMSQWLYSKSFKVAEARLGAETNHSRFLVKYFTSFGDSMRCVHFNGKKIDKDLMYLVACYCKNITNLRCTNVSLSLPFHAILRNNPNIREIRIRNATCMLDGLMDDLSLHKLLIFSAQDIVCLKGFPWSESAHSNSLQRAECINANFFMCDIKALTQNCPSLHSLSCARVHTLDTCTRNYLGNRPEMIHLSIFGNDAVTDDAILFTAQNLSSLRTLNIQNCKRLTSTSLSHIAEHCRKLEVLYCDLNDASDATERAVEAFSQKGTTIEYLNIYSEFVLCSTTCTSSLLLGCPALHTLVINELAHISPSSRKLCAVMRPQLKILVHDQSTEYNVLTMPV